MTHTDLMVLAGGETYSELAGCRIVRVSNDYLNEDDLVDFAETVTKFEQDHFGEVATADNTSQ